MFFKKHRFNIISIGISLIAAIMSVVFSMYTAAMVWLLCATIYAVSLRFDVDNEKEQEQEKLIAALQRKVEALDEYVQALAERENLDYEHLKQRDEIIAETIKKIENEVK